jgi:hypothetical protein
MTCPRFDYAMSAFGSVLWFNFANIMVDYSCFDFSKICVTYDYLDKIPFQKRIGLLVDRSYLLQSSILERDQYVHGATYIASLNSIAECVKIDQKYQPLIQYHEGRIDRFHRNLLIFSSLITVMSIIFLIVIDNFTRDLDKISSLSATRTTYVTMKICLAVVMFSMYSNLCQRASFYLSLRSCADSVIAYYCLSSVVDLSEDDIMENMVKRRSLLHRLEIISNSIKHISNFYLLKGSAQSADHFLMMANFIRKRQNWLMCPKASTLNDLRQDMYNFSEIVLSGQYGEFEWENDLQSLTKQKEGVVLSLLSWSIALVPLVFMWIALWQQEWLKSRGISTNFIAMLSLAWMLLVIDTKLKLGVVERVVSIAKGIKDMA